MTDNKIEDKQLIFATDFDNHPDWMIQHDGQRYSSPNSTASDGRSGYVAKDNIPDGFDFYYTSERWHPNGDKDGENVFPDAEPVAQINNREGSHLSPDGKSLIITDESYGSNGQWGADAVFTKDLGKEYKELFTEIYVKFMPGFRFHAVEEGSGQSSMKFFRARRFSGITTNSRFSYFGEDSRSGSPVATLKLKEWGVSDTRAVTRINIATHGYTHPDTYKTEDDYYSFKDGYDNKIEEGIYQGGDKGLRWTDIFDDGEFHKINIRFKMDSTPGAGDGVVEVWVDDYLEVQATDVPWRELGHPEQLGWNEVAIGGNQHNLWEPEEERAEQWYAVSSMKVCGVPVDADDSEVIEHEPDEPDESVIDPEPSEPEETKKSVISWIAPESNVDGTPIDYDIQYEVGVKVNGAFEPKTTLSAQAKDGRYEASLDGLGLGYGEHTIALRTFAKDDPARKSEWSDPVNFTISNQTPNPPMDVRIT